MGATQVVIIGGITFAIIASQLSNKKRDSYELRRSVNTTLSKNETSDTIQRTIYKNALINHKNAIVVKEKNPGSQYRLRKKNNIK